MTDAQINRADTPYRQGWEARLQDEPITSNPYPVFGQDWTRWVAGFMDRDEHEAGRDEALNSIGWNR